VGEALDAVVRPARPGDGAALARIWLENARYYVDRFPADFRLPDESGLAERFDPPVDGEDAVLLVAELGGRVGAYAYATVSPPEDDARYQYLAPYAQARAHVEALGTGDAFLRRGLATRLVEACEQWARGRGAAQISATTYAASEVSVPFWEERMGYRRRGITFVKRLDA
jgi:GNAT superfamily N-acetyltransferase